MPSVFENYHDIIPAYAEFVKSLQNPLPGHLRINRLRAGPEQVLPDLQTEGGPLRRSLPHDDCLYWAPGLSTPGNRIEYFLGHIHPQALTSCLAALMLRPRRHMLVLDLCAAPGGKTAHMAQLMENSGLIVANELNLRRHVPLGDTLARLGVLNTVVTAYQAQEFPLRQPFDRILADVPCSGEGRFRQVKAGAVYRPPRNPTRLPELQRKILIRGFDLLRPGGEILYATCTYNPLENEAVVQELLQCRKHARLLPLPLDGGQEPGLQEWKGASFDECMVRAGRFYPHRIDSVGFFMARIGNPG